MLIMYYNYFGSSNVTKWGDNQSTYPKINVFLHLTYFRFKNTEEPSFSCFWPEVQMHLCLNHVQSQKEKKKEKWQIGRKKKNY